MQMPIWVGDSLRSMFSIRYPHEQVDLTLRVTEFRPNNLKSKTEVFRSLTLTLVIYMKKILFILVANIALFTGTVFASESVGSISTGISTGLDFTLPCNPVSVLNGSVNPQTCTITCNSGYTLSGTTCNAVPVTG